MSSEENATACRLPLNRLTTIRLGHGSGGRLTSDLLEQIFYKHLKPAGDGFSDDAAIINIGGERIAITTDSYVVQPIVFPGGNIGTLAINGTINDLAMRGAMPSHITAAFILEEGLALSELEPIVSAMAAACREHGVEFAAGDTKVVNKGAGDKVFITTTGIGRVVLDEPPSCKRAAKGDAVILSGDIGRHGIAVMCARESLQLEVDLESDCAALHGLVKELVSANVEVHCLRDVTRGGLATVLNELAHSSGVGIEFAEAAVPLHPSVASVCELLGLDPMYVACEGRFVCIVPAAQSAAALDCMRAHELGRDAMVIGQVTNDHIGRVICESAIGGKRILDKLSGEQLPRIC